MRVDECRPAVDHLDVVARQRVTHNLDLALDDAADMPHELLHRGPTMRAELVRGFESGSGIGAADRLAKGLRGDRPGLDADAPDTPLLFHHGHPLPELRGLDGGPLSGRTAADADQVNVEATLRHDDCLSCAA